MSCASTAPSLSVYASIGVPLGIFPNGCVVTVVFAPANVAPTPKQRIPIAIALSIVSQPRKLRQRMECITTRHCKAAKRRCQFLVPCRFLVACGGRREARQTADSTQRRGQTVTPRTQLLELLYYLAPRHTPN